jgi:hypothetical protein
MRKHAPLLSTLSVSFLLTAGCGIYLDLEPDDRPPPDAAPPDAGPGYPLLPPRQAFPDQPVVTTPGEAPAPPPGDVDDGVHLVFPPPVSITTAREVTVRGTARLAGGVTAVRVNGVDARLSPPSAGGAVAWQADVQVTGGTSELVVSSVAGNGAVTPAAATASLTFSPDMRARPHMMGFDVGHDRVLVSDHMQGLVAIDLATGTPTSLRLQENAGGPMTISSLSLDPATGRALALFQQTSCHDDARQQVSGVVSIDLRDGATAIAEEFARADCGAPVESPYAYEDPVVLHAGSARYSYAVTTCDDLGNCHAELRRRQIGGSPLDDVPLCDSRQCWVLDMRADQAGTGLLALVRDGVSTRPADTSYEMRAIDPVTGAQTLLATVQTEWDDTRFLPGELVVDAAGNRVLVLARSVIAGVVSNQLSVIAIDLATAVQSLLHRDLAGVDDDGSWFGDAAYDPRRDRLLFADYGRGLTAVDLATGAASVLLRPAIGDGPIPSCLENGPCEFSNLDPGRQRFFVHVPTAYQESDIYLVDLTTGDRRLLSPGGSAIEFGSSPRLLADDVEDRLLIVHENRSLYVVDGATGEREYMGTVPVFDRGSVAWDPARNDILYVAAQDGGRALRAFDVDTREDRVISSDTVGSGPPLRPADGFPPRDDELIVTLDASSGRAFVSQIYGRVLLGVDLVTGDRTSHAVDGLGAQPAEPGWPQRVLADTRRNRILVGEYPRYAIGAIDLSTGAVDTFIDYYRADPPLWLTVALIPDHANDRALIVDDEQSVHMLDLQTGQRVLILQTGY